MGYPSYSGSSPHLESLTLQIPFPWIVTLKNSGDGDVDPIGKEHHSTSYVSDCTQKSNPGKGENLCRAGEAGSTVARPAADIPCDGAELEGLRGPG